MVPPLAIAAPHDTRSLGHVDAQLIADYPEAALFAVWAAEMLAAIGDTAWR